MAIEYEIESENEDLDLWFCRSQWANKSNTKWYGQERESLTGSQILGLGLYCRKDLLA